MPEPRKEEVDPLFAAYGHACSQGQLLEDALRLLLLIGREYAKTQIPEEAIRYPVDTEGIKTLGELFHEVFKVEVLGGQEQRFIWKAIKLRNRLIHRFWTEDQRWEILTPEGRRQLIDELEGAWRLLRTATAIVHEMLNRYLAADGQSMQRYMDQAAMLWESDITLPADEELIH